ncbi:MAG: V-type ATP synthase subunit E [Vulcanisaeta sp. AZ3]|nr:MAG: ATPase [Vulcanisaeta sp. AZ3]
MSEQELVERLINGVVTRLTNEINEWSNNLRLRAEAELLDSAKNVIDKYAVTLENIDNELNMEKEYKLYNEMMKTKREKLNAVEEAYAEVVRRIKERISSMKGTDDYKKFLKKSILWATSIVGSRELIVTVNEKDKNIVEEIISELGLNAVINTTDKEMLGVLVSSADGSIRVDATLESRLNLMEHQIKSLLTHIALTS